MSTLDVKNLQSPTNFDLTLNANGSGSDIKFQSNAVEKASIDQDGNVIAAGTISSTGDTTITSGDIVFATAGKGVCLGVTSNTDANTLDDYEEGTWTPTNNGGSISLSVTSARYTKIGRLVHVHAYLGTSADGDGTQMVIGGLPFAASSNTYEMGIGRFSGYGSTGNAYVSTVSGQSYLWVVDSNTMLNENDVDAGGGDWNINVTYHTG